MSQIAERIIVAVVTIVIAVNAAFMLISPSAWFRLPPWLRATGTMREENYRSALAEIGIRLGGMAMLGTILWCAYDFWFAKR
jgi:hypothetical protein